MPTGLFTLTQVNQAVRQGAWTGFIAPTWVEYLVVAGGGGGSNAAGGAGGLLSGVVTVAANTSYTVTVGAGGSTPAGNGNNSVFGSISTVAGGGGTNGDINGKSGGSGGGAGYGGTFAAGQGTAGQGSAGGLGAGTSGTDRHGGGGGGAGTIGGNATTTFGGFGGSGIASAISGAVVTYAGGGGGGGGVAGGAGGVGGGGTGSTGSGSAGGGNTGGGGGGGYATGGGAGGSGVVIIRYPGTVQYFTGGTLSYANGYVIHTFNASGTLAPTTPTPYVATDYQISRSLRFNSADSAWLSRTFSSSSNQKTWTWSGWIKRGKLDVTQYSGFISNTGNGFRINDDSPGNQIRVRIANTSSIYAPVLRDPSAWYHIVIAIDTTQVVAADRIKVYINNQLAALASGSIPAQNSDTGVNTAALHGIGADPTPTQYFDGYMTEVNFIDGQALTPSSFGYYDFSTGVWAPTKYVGVYGTNGFYLNFSDNSNTTAATLGADYSGNGNNWTPNNFSVSAGAGNDSLVDVPTNWGTDTGVGGTVRGNYCTLNPLDKFPAATAASNGNLDVVLNTGTSPDDTNIVATMAFNSGKWYWECIWTADGAPIFGVWDTAASGPSRNRGTANFYAYLTSGSKYNGGSATAYGASWTIGDVIGVALDMDAGTLTFYKNGTSQGTAFSSLTGKTLVPAVFVSTGSTNAVIAANTNFGQRPFAYTAPSGFKALNTQNLPTPTIGATTATQANKFFDVTTYTGNGSSQSITNSGSMQPDLVWGKNRASVVNHGLIDSVRGVSRWMGSNTADAEGYSPGFYVTAFNPSGFTVGDGSVFNTSGSAYVAWQWRASNAAAVTNTAGSITSTVSANTTSGFSVVTCTTQSSGTGTAGHGLGAAPAMIIVKQRANTSDWNVYHRSIGSGGAVRLNTTQSTLTSSAFWNDTAPTSTVFTFGSGYGSSVSVVAYCFSEIPGYSRFGSFVGNGSADGPFVFCGFRPRYILFKTTASLDQPWGVVDTTRSPSNLANLNISPTFSSAENSGYAKMDILSNGFKIRETDNFLNNNGSTYIFAAFAESPFKYALAR